MTTREERAAIGRRAVAVRWARVQAGLEPGPSMKAEAHGRQSTRKEKSLARADGCHLHDHCLTCPLPACIFEDKPSKEAK